MSPWLVAVIVYALLAWSAYMLIGIANEKVGNENRIGQAVAMSVLWPLTLVFVVVASINWVIKDRKRRHVSSDTNSAHRSGDIDEGKE